MTRSFFRTRARLILMSLAVIAGLIGSGSSPATADPAPMATSQAARSALTADDLEWIEQGPAPLSGASVSLNGDDVAAGAVEAIAAHPDDPNILYVGAVGGGVWRTNEATKANPHWEPLTDDLPSMAISALVMSPIDPDTLYAGTGSFTAGGSGIGGRAVGIYRTRDAGETWEILGREIFERTTDTELGSQVRSVATLDDQTLLVAAVNNPGTTNEPNDEVGLFMSPDAGVSWTKVSGQSGAGDGVDNDADGITDEPDELNLPAGEVSHLVRDPRQDATFYLAVPRFKNRGYWGDGVANNRQNVERTEEAGVYRSDDGGLTWRKVAGLPTADLEKSGRLELAVSPVKGGPVYVALISTGVIGAGGTPIITPAGSLIGVYRTDNTGGWRRISFLNPLTRQGNVHFAMVADRTDADVVYVGGIRPIYRVDSSSVPASADSVTSIGTSPHVDSRDMVFDADGNLLQSDDGGIYRLFLENSANGRDDDGDGETDEWDEMAEWVSVNGDVGAIEILQAAYDPLNNVLLGGTQDNGVIRSDPINPATGEPRPPRWDQIMGGDGLEQAVAVEVNSTTGAEESVHYSRNNGRFVRHRFDSNNQEISRTSLLPIPGVTATDSARLASLRAPKSAPFAVNAVDPARIMLGGEELYESNNQLDSARIVSPAGATGVVSALAYGGFRNGAANPDIAYVGYNEGTALLWRRVAAGVPFQAVNAYEAAGGRRPLRIVIDPQDWNQVYVLDLFNGLWYSPDAGQSWLQLNGDLESDRYVDPWSLALAGSGRQQLIVVAGFGGAFATRLEACGPDGCSWEQYGTELPTARVHQLIYDDRDNLLVAATFGRGFWILPLEPPLVPACPTVEFGGERLVGTFNSKPTTDPITVDLPDGNYEIILESADPAHPASSTQPNEQWVLEGLDNQNNVILTTTASDDLPNEATSNITNVGNYTVTGVVTVRARHANIGPASNSIEPVRATFINDKCSTALNSVPMANPDGATTDKRTALTVGPGPTLVGRFGQLGSELGDFIFPWGVAVDPENGNVVIADSDNDRVQICDQLGDCTKLGSFENVREVAVDPNTGNIVLIDSRPDQIHVCEQASGVCTSFGSTGNAIGQFRDPAGVAVDPVTGDVVIADNANHRVQVCDQQGISCSTFGGKGSDLGEFVNPFAVAVDPGTRNIIISDSGNGRVQSCDQTGTSCHLLPLVTPVGGLVLAPRGVAVDPATGNVIIAEVSAFQLQICDRAGTRCEVFGDFVFPQRVAVDPATSNIIVTQWAISEIDTYTPGGVLANDTDPDNDPLTVTAFDAVSAAGAAVAVGPDGSYSYDPTGSATLQALATGQSLTDSFRYTIDDGRGGTATTNVTILVAGAK